MFHINSINSVTFHLFAWLCFCQPHNRVKTHSLSIAKLGSSMRLHFPFKCMTVDTYSVTFGLNNCLTVPSHTVHHAQVSSAFTCSSVQRGLYVAVSSGTRSSKCIQRAAAETTEAHVIPLPLCSWSGGRKHRGCWWRRVSGYKRWFASFPTPNGLVQVDVRYAVCFLLH